MEKFGPRLRDIADMSAHGAHATLVTSFWLLNYSPDIWGCSVCTVDGQRFSLGDTDGLFTLQSCSKVSVVYYIVHSREFFSLHVRYLRDHAT